MIPLFVIGQRDVRQSLRVGGSIVAEEDNGLIYKLREEFRFSTDTSQNSNIVFFAPGIGYQFSEQLKVTGEYWIFLNQRQNRINVDFDADFGNFASRIRFQSGWEEFVDHNEAVRFLFRFKQDDGMKGIFNPSVDFEVFSEFGTLKMLDRYRGGISNKFKISDNMICLIGITSQEFVGNNRRDYLYRFRITYKI